MAQAHKKDTKIIPHHFKTAISCFLASLVHLYQCATLLII